MRPSELPLVGAVFSSGADDRILDSLLLLGPVVIVILAALGRSPLTVGLALSYLGAFAFHVLTVGFRSNE